MFKSYFSGFLENVEDPFLLIFGLFELASLLFSPFSLQHNNCLFEGHFLSPFESFNDLNLLFFGLFGFPLSSGSPSPLKNYHSFFEGHFWFRLENFDHLLLLSGGFSFLRLIRRFSWLKGFISRRLGLIKFGFVFLRLNREPFLSFCSEFSLHNNNSLFKSERFFRFKDLKNLFFLLACLGFG